MYENESNISNIVQLDGNVSYLSSIDDQPYVPRHDKRKNKNLEVLSLPTVATYNLRSFLPKAGNLTTDMLERGIDCAFLTEIWEQTDKKEQKDMIETMLETNGLKYISCPRPPNTKGISYGGAAIVVNLRKFSVEKIMITVPKNLEVVWGLLKAKAQCTKFKKIIVCSFYSPPSKKRNSKMADHIVSTLHICCTQDILIAG